MNVAIRPLRGDEYPAWLERVKEGYARNMVDNGGVPPDAAREKSELDHANALPAGAATAGHYLFAIEGDGDVIGSLWLADRTDSDLGRSMFLYSIEVDEPFRGRGVGRSAMRLAEDVARERGHDAITLNVFGGNDVARGLYRSLGYHELAVFMRKGL